MKKHSAFFVPGIIMVGLVLRTPFDVLPIVLSDIADGLHVSLSSLGLLTSLPLVMFALCSSFSPRLAQKFGLEKLEFYILLRRVNRIKRQVVGSDEAIFSKKRDDGFGLGQK